MEPVPLSRRFVTGLLEEFENRRCGESDDEDDGPNDDDSLESLSLINDSPRLLKFLLRDWQVLRLFVRHCSAYLLLGD